MFVVFFSFVCCLVVGGCGYGALRPSPFGFPPARSGCRSNHHYYYYSSELFPRRRLRPDCRCYIHRSLGRADAGDAGHRFGVSCAALSTLPIHAAGCCASRVRGLWSRGPRRSDDPLPRPVHSGRAYGTGGIHARLPRLLGGNCCGLPRGPSAGVSARYVYQVGGPSHSGS